MILIVSMMQPETYRRSGDTWRIKARFEEMTGRPALYAHHTQVDPEFVKAYPIKAIFIGGFAYGWGNLPPKDIYGINDVLHKSDLPILAACGGHQLVGWCFNHDVRKLKSFKDLAMRKLREGEPDWNQNYHPGYFMEMGIHGIDILKRDPIFAGMKKRVLLPESHFAEVKKLPPGFIHLARNDNCEIQCMRHEDRPLYGAQFHAENWNEDYPDGEMFIRNFFRIAGLVE